MSRRFIMRGGQMVFADPGYDAETAPNLDKIFDPFNFIYNAIYNVVPIPASSFSQTSNSNGVVVYSATVGFGKTFGNVPGVLVLVQSIDGTFAFPTAALMEESTYTYNGTSMVAWQTVTNQVSTSALTVHFTQALAYPGGTNDWPFARNVAAMVFAF